VSSKFYTNFIKAIMIILGITLLLLAIVYPWLILLAAAIFYFAYKYKAPDKTSKTNEIYHVKENAHTPGFTEYFLITDPKQLPSKLVFIDFETTGLSSLTDRIVEVGIATYENMELVDTYSQLIDPEINIDPKASAVNGITYAMVKGKPKLKDVISEVYQRIEGQVIVGYNIDFDLSFLKYALSENNTELSDVRAFDVLRLVKETLRYKDTGDRKLESVKILGTMNKLQGRARIHVYDPQGKQYEVSDYAGLAAEGQAAKREVEITADKPQSGTWEVVVYSSATLGLYNLDKSDFVLSVELTQSQSYDLGFKELDLIVGCALPIEARKSELVQLNVLDGEQRPYDGKLLINNRLYEVRDGKVKIFPSFEHNDLHLTIQRVP
jgi:oligoribonuclease (3'-5' exoribonuclease)